LQVFPLSKGRSAVLSGGSRRAKLTHNGPYDGPARSNFRENRPVNTQKDWPSRLSGALSGVAPSEPITGPLLDKYLDAPYPYAKDAIRKSMSLGGYKPAILSNGSTAMLQRWGPIPEARKTLPS
jgi:hypothetical protein